MHREFSVWGISVLIIAFVATAAPAQTLQDLFKGPRVVEARDNVLTAADDLNSALADFRDEVERSLSMPSKVARACVLLALECLKESNAIGEATAASGAFLATEVALFIVKGYDVSPKVFREKCLNLQNPRFGSGPFFPLPFSLKRTAKPWPSLVPMSPIDDEDEEDEGSASPFSMSLGTMLLLIGSFGEMSSDAKYWLLFLIGLIVLFYGEGSPADAGLPFAASAEVMQRADELPEEVQAFIEELKTEVNAIDLKLYELEALLIDGEVLVNSCASNLLEVLASLQLARRPVTGAEANMRKAASALKRCERDLSRLIRIGHQLIRIVKDINLDVLLLHKKLFLLVPVPALAQASPLRGGEVDAATVLKVFTANGRLVTTLSNPSIADPARAMHGLGLANGTYLAVIESVDTNGRITRRVKPVVVLH